MSIGAANTGRSRPGVARAQRGTPGSMTKRASATRKSPDAAWRFRGTTGRSGQRASPDRGGGGEHLVIARFYSTAAQREAFIAYGRTSVGRVRNAPAVLDRIVRRGRTDRCSRRTRAAGAAPPPASCLGAGRDQRWAAPPGPSRTFPRSTPCSIRRTCRCWWRMPRRRSARLRGDVAEFDGRGGVCRDLRGAERSARPFAATAHHARRLELKQNAAKSPSSSSSRGVAAEGMHYQLCSRHPARRDAFAPPDEKGRPSAGAGLFSPIGVRLTARRTPRSPPRSPRTECPRATACR